MAVVVDSNLIVVLVNGDPRGERALRLFQDWRRQEIKIHAPDLAYYEIANALTRSIVARLFAPEDLEAAWNFIEGLPIVYHKFSQTTRVVEIALSLRRQSAYDAVYLALAESLGAELWTLDGPLYRNAIGLGFPVRLLADLADEG